MSLVILPLSVIEITSVFVFETTFSLFLSFLHLTRKFDMICVHFCDSFIYVSFTFFFEKLKGLLVVSFDITCVVFFVLWYILDEFRSIIVKCSILIIINFLFLNHRYWPSYILRFILTIPRICQTSWFRIHSLSNFISKQSTNFQFSSLFVIVNLKRLTQAISKRRL